jgi:hypothetical protein
MCSSSCFGGLCYRGAFMHLLLLCSLVFRLSRRIHLFACWLRCSVKLSYLNCSTQFRDDRRLSLGNTDCPKSARTFIHISSFHGFREVPSAFMNSLLWFTVIGELRCTESRSLTAHGRFVDL